MFIECSTKEKYSLLTNLHNRLFSTEEQQESETTTTAVSNNLSLKERLFAKINKCERTEVLISNDGSWIRKELGLFEKNHIIPDWLLKLENALLSIKSSSAESERVFSTGGKFLSDKCQTKQLTY